MKKLFLLILLTASKVFCDSWVHFANDTDSRIEVSADLIIRKNFEKIINRAIVEPYSVKFINTKSIFIDSFGQITAKSLTGKTKGVTQILGPTSKANYQAFVFRPTIVEGKPGFEIKQRIEKDAELILEKHKVPTNPKFVN